MSDSITVMPVPLWTAVGPFAWMLLSPVTYPGGPGWGHDDLADRDAAVRLGETGSLYQAETPGGPHRPGAVGLHMHTPPLGVAVTPRSD